MTTAAAMICADGLVIGTDMKVTGGGRKWKNSKLLIEAKLDKCRLFFAVAGRTRHVTDAMSWMELNNLTKVLGENPSFDDFLDKIVEIRLPQFATDFRRKYGEYPSVHMIIGCIDKNKIPRLVEVYNDGDYDYKDDFAAIGSGSIFGEILLRKLYNPQIPIALAKRLIGYIIWEIQEIDNNSGEGIQIVATSKDGKLEKVDDLEIEVYKQLPSLITESYEAIRTRIEHLNIEELKKEVRKFQDILRRVSTSQIESEALHGKVSKGTTKPNRKKTTTG